MLYILQALIIVVAALQIALTLALNTKSEGLGAAITGASDSYRGAVGVEEQKRHMLRLMCYSFMVLSLIYSVSGRWI